MTNKGLMQTLNLTPISDKDLDILASKIPELHKVPFQHVYSVLQEIDETYSIMCQTDY